MSGPSGEEQSRSSRRRWMIVAVVGVVLTALASRLWLRKEPAERLEFEVPADATCYYARYLGFEDQTGWNVVWHKSPVSSESGRTLVNLVQQSEQQADRRWEFQVAWPPIRKELKSIVLRATFSVGGTIIELRFQDESTFMAAGRLFAVPEENRAELSALLDALDAECQLAFDKEHHEAVDHSDEESEQAEH